MATTERHGYNPNQAGEALLVFCTIARRELFARLVRPAESIVEAPDAWEAYFVRMTDIRNMDHRELRAALRSNA
jgi:hypothetical protein